MTLYQNHAGLHISKSKLQIVELIHRNDRFILGNVDEENFQDFFSFNDRESKIISILQSAYNGLVSRRPVKSSSISFSLSNSSFKSFDIPFDKSLAKDDLLEHLIWELSVLYPELKGGNYLIQNVKVTGGDYREGSNMIVFVLEKNILRTLYKFCQRNNLNLRFVDHEHMSANSIIFLEHEKNKDSLFCSIYINDNYFSIMLLHQFRPIYFRNREFHNPDEFITVANNEIDNIRSLVGDLSHISASYLHGSVYSKSILGQINMLSDLEFTYSNPFSKIDIDDMIKDTEFIKEKYNLFCAAAGVAFRVA
jgi:hypothetical protein